MAIFDSSKMSRVRCRVPYSISIASIEYEYSNEYFLLQNRRKVWAKTEILTVIAVTKRLMSENQLAK